MAGAGSWWLMFCVSTQEAERGQKSHRPYGNGHPPAKPPPEGPTSPQRAPPVGEQLFNHTVYGGFLSFKSPQSLKSHIHLNM